MTGREQAHQEGNLSTGCTAGLVPCEVCAGRESTAPYTVTLRDRLAIPVINATFWLATPAYRDRVKRLIVGGMKHGY